MELGAQLRALRRRAGLAADALAGRAGMSPPKISRIENGRITVSVEDVERLAQLLGADPERAAALIDQARSLSNQVRTWRGWQRLDLAGHQKQFGELEAAAHLIRGFQPTVVPGLLQTAEYARQVFLRSGVGGTTAELAAAVRARLDRQAVLFDPSKRFVFLLTESALRTRICPESVMTVQLDRIGTLGSLENVTIGYLPATVELDVVPVNGFTIYDDRVVFAETLSTELILRDDRDIEVHIDAFERLLAAALVGPAAIDALRAVSATPGTSPANTAANRGMSHEATV